MKNTSLLTKDHLPGSDIYLYQAKDMFRMNTDSHLLGEFMTVKSNETVLDIGVNNGVLLLYAYRFKPKFMVGVDIQEEACEIAKTNMAFHQIENAEIYCANITEFEYTPVDVIVCNPPYFQEQDSSANEKIRIARDATYLPMDELFQAIGRLLNEKGRCYMIHRVSRLNELYMALLANGLNIRQLTMIYHENHDYAHGILVEIVKGKKVHLKVNAPIWNKR